MTGFFDSNIILYLFDDDNPRKAARAEALVGAGGTVSVQVLNEVVSVLRRKQQRDWAVIARIVMTTRALVGVVPLTVAIHDDGRRLAERYGLNIYDAMIVAAALAAGCDTLWSEDMHDGLVVDDRLTVRNPFA